MQCSMTLAGWTRLTWRTGLGLQAAPGGGRLARHQGGEPASRPGGMMQPLEQQRQYCLATLSSPTRSSPACGTAGYGSHGDGRLVADLVTLHGTSPTWPASVPPHTHLEERGIEALVDRNELKHTRFGSPYCRDISMWLSTRCREGQLALGPHEPRAPLSSVDYVVW